METHHGTTSPKRNVAGLGLSARTFCLMLASLLALVPAASVASAADVSSTPVRFGLTAAAAREDLKLYERWATYLGRKVGRRVRFEQRRTYREAMELIEIGEHDFSWICSFPYARYRDAKGLGLLVAPVFEGRPLYRAYIIVAKDSPITSLSELEGKIFAFSDPDSNTGYVVPRVMLRDLMKNPDSFFRHTFFTYSHSETIQAVAERVADGASVNSYIWEYLNRHQPELTSKTQIIERSRTYGFPPLVYRTGVDPGLLARMTDALMTMDYDPEGRAILADLMLDGFEKVSPNHYDDVRANIDRR